MAINIYIRLAPKKMARKVGSSTVDKVFVGNKRAWEAAVKQRFSNAVISENRGRLYAKVGNEIVGEYSTGGSELNWVDHVQAKDAFNFETAPFYILLRDTEFPARLGWKKPNLTNGNFYVNGSTVFYQVQPGKFVPYFAKTGTPFAMSESNFRKQTRDAASFRPGEKIKWGNVTVTYVGPDPLTHHLVKIKLASGFTRSVDPAELSKMPNAKDSSTVTKDYASEFLKRLDDEIKAVTVKMAAEKSASKKALFEESLRQLKRERAKYRDNGETKDDLRKEITRDYTSVFLKDHDVKVMKRLGYSVASDTKNTDGTYTVVYRKP